MASGLYSVVIIVDLTQVVMHAFVGHAVSCVYKSVTHAVVWPKKTGSCHRLASVYIVCHRLPDRTLCSAA